MKTAFVKVGFLVLIGSVVLAQQPAKPPKNAKPTFALTVSTDQDTVAPGAKMIVTIHLTNVSGAEFRQVRVWRAASCLPCGRQGQLAPYAEDYGKRLRREPRYNQPIVGRGAGYGVEKGETATETIEVTKQYDLRTPGKYTFRVSHPDPEANVDVWSNTIT